jgi:hypothetical protein
VEKEAGTSHFNALTEAEQERLAILIEECGEVVQAGCKILRHGYGSTNPNIPLSENNRQMLERELGDLMHAMNRMVEQHDLDWYVIERRTFSKPERIKPYLHHQEA